MPLCVCVCVWIYEARLLYVPDKCPLLTLTLACSPGGPSVHPALTTSGVAVFAKPCPRCWYYVYALTLPFQHSYSERLSVLPAQHWSTRGTMQVLVCLLTF